jgi:hypothetical protein
MSKRATAADHALGKQQGCRMMQTDTRDTDQTCNQDAGVIDMKP